MAIEDSSERRVLAALRRIVQAIDLHSRQLLAECEVTSPQLVCLHALAADGPVTSRVLAEKVHISASTLVGILDRLEAKGLVSRRRNQEDRRAIFVDLTRQGKAFVETAPSPLQTALADRLRQLSGRHQRQLAESLEEIVGLMQAESLPEIPVLATSRFSKQNGR